MGMFSRLKGIFKKADGQSTAPGGDEGLEDVRKEMRMHTRYAISFHRNAIVRVNDTWVGRIMDLSYGGAAVKFEFPDKVPSEALNLDNEVEIDVLGHRQRFQTKSVRTIPHGERTCYVGLCFNHATPDTLIFLREIIEPMRQGLSLDSIPMSLRAEKYKDTSWNCFRGEGPIDITFKLDSDRITDGLVTFKMTDRYFEVAITDGVLRTAKSAERARHTMAVGAQMIPSATPDKDTLRRAFLILASAPATVADAAAPLLKMIDQHIEVRHKEKGAA